MNKLVHWEIPSTDLGASSRFYAELFGWTMQPSGDSYVVFGVEDGVGGGLNKVDVVPAPGIEVYIGVPDIPAALAQATALGGRVAQEKTEIGGDMGFWAAIEDPCGCRIAVWSQS
jgi:uncharacterized protein